MTNEDIDLPVIYFDRGCHMISPVSMHEMKMFEIERRVLLSPRKSHGGNTSRR